MSYSGMVVAAILSRATVPAKCGWYWWYVPERYIAHWPFPCEEAALDNVQMKDWENIPPRGALGVSSS